MPHIKIKQKAQKGQLQTEPTPKRHQENDASDEEDFLIEQEDPLDRFNNSRQ